jgi:hypothetical protein
MLVVTAELDDTLIFLPLFIHNAECWLTFHYSFSGTYVPMYWRVKGSKTYRGYVKLRIIPKIIHIHIYIYKVIFM